MFYRALGSTGMQVSVLGFGTVKLGRTEGVKYPQAFTVPDDKEARALLDLSRDLGINLIDTAPAYGNSEERLGKLLKTDRKQWLICSKVGEEFLDGQSTFDFSAAHTRMSVERSLRRLQTDYIDMVLVHSDGNDLDIIQNSEALETLAELKQRGWIRAFGMSTKTVAGGLLAAEQSDVVMVTYNLNEQADVAVLDYCREHNKGALIKK
ncbi:MAG TPA: aldo/keto reductase, partial [Pseudomonadales bacterium]|nr:aldo/keto reductase [Pseudomonadales bacterium]